MGRTGQMCLLLSLSANSSDRMEQENIQQYDAKDSKYCIHEEFDGWAISEPPVLSAKPIPETEFMSRFHSELSHPTHNEHRRECKTGNDEGPAQGYGERSHFIFPLVQRRISRKALPHSGFSGSKYIHLSPFIIFSRSALRLSAQAFRTFSLCS